MALADRFKIPSKCGKEIPKSFRDLHLGDILTCECGVTIKITGDDPQETARGLDGIDKAFKGIKDLCRKR
jgi:hypothetical protein